MVNESGLVPLGRAVLVQMEELKRPKGLLHIPESVENSSAAVEKKATVVAVGGEAWADEKEPRCAPGDRVFVTAFAGFVTRGPKDGKPYRLVNDRDIFCKIVEEKANG